MNNKNALAFLANEAYLKYTRQMVYSARVFGHWEEEIILLAYEITDASWFEERGVTVVHINRKEFNFSDIPQDKIVYFAKIILFHTRFSAWNKIIYLDTDMLIRKDLRPLLRYSSFAAADDCFQYPLIHQLSPPGKPYENAEINKYYPPEILRKVSFNTGLMVIPVRENTIEEYDAICELTQQFWQHSVFFDQGILNLHFISAKLFLKGLMEPTFVRSPARENLSHVGFIHKRKRIPYIYNDYYLSEYFNRHGLLRRFSDRYAAVLHIIHPNKPWNPENEYHREWLDRMQAAEANTFYQTGGETPSRYSEWVVDRINQMNIRWIYFSGGVSNFFAHTLWQCGRYFRKHLPFLFSKNHP